MAQLWTSNFDALTVGNAVSGWVDVVGTWQVVARNPVSGSQAFGPSPASDNAIALYTGAAAIADGGIKYDFKVVSGNNSQLPGLIVKSNAGCSTAYLIWPYNLFGGLSFGAYKRSGTNWTAVGSASSTLFTLSDGQTVHVRIKIVAQVISVYAWIDSAAEPSTPTWQITMDSSIASATTGYTGFWYPTGALTTSAVSVDNVEVFDNVAAATALTLPGPPTSGGVGVASTNFTVTANGALSANVNVTPSDGGAGGTFTPSTVVLEPGAVSDTFTYTPASSGAKTVSITNDGGLTNPASVTYTATGATAVQFNTAPTTGYTGVASSNFVVGANGTITGTVRVTPSDSGGGGTFTPAFVDISSGSPTGSFTYTPASVGAKSISLTNDGGLTNPGAVTYTAAVAPVSIAVDNSNLVWSPYNWDLLQVGDFGITTKSRQSCCAGAYLKLKFSGATSLSLSIDAAGLLPVSAQLRVVVNGTAESYINVTSSTATLAIASGLSTGTTYDVLIQIHATSETASGGRWGTAGVSPTNVVRINQILLSSGSILLTSPASGGYDLYYGDSITEAALATGTFSYPGDRGRMYGQYLGIGLNAEYGVVGYGGSGWAAAGNGSVPNFPSHWNFHSTGRPRDFATNPPTRVTVMHGTNGSTDSATVQAWLGSARTAFGSATWIFIVVPPGAYAKAALTAAVSAYLTASGDTKCALIDFSDRLPVVWFSGGYMTTDTIHVKDWAQGFLAAAIENKMLAAIAAAGATPHAPKFKQMLLTRR